MVSGRSHAADSPVGPSNRLAVCLIHFVLAVTSGWGLKRSTGRQAMAAFGIFFGHSLLCLLRHTHPNPGHLQRLLCDKSRRYSSVLFVTLIVGELQVSSGLADLGHPIDGIFAFRPSTQRPKLASSSAPTGTDWPLDSGPAPWPWPSVASGRPATVAAPSAPALSSWMPPTWASASCGTFTVCGTLPSWTSTGGPWAWPCSSS